jgi:acetoin utilization deacetylase AcuC-like enzyme
MTLFYYDPLFVEHQTGNHPERAARVLGVMQFLQTQNMTDRLVRPNWESATEERILSVHTPQHLAKLKDFASSGGGNLDADTVVSGKSFEVACRAAGAVCDAVVRVVAGEDKNAFCLVRPPGHHATTDQAMGFCLLNHVAIGARVAVNELGVRRVLIVDFDVHHGNGTQAIFWEDADVGYFSMHRWPLYPGTGDADEIGAGDGLGTTMNLPIRFGTSRQQQLDQFDQAVNRFAQRMEPELVMISAGFDSHKDDPIGSLGLESEDFRTLTQSLVRVADRYCRGKIVSVLEGGYNVDALAQCVHIHLEELLLLSHPD